MSKDTPAEEVNGIKDVVKLIAYKAWVGAANAYRLYPDNKHTFIEYWDNAKELYNDEVKLIASKYSASPPDAGKEQEAGWMDVITIAHTFEFQLAVEELKSKYTLCKQNK